MRQAPPAPLGRRALAGALLLACASLLLGLVLAGRWVREAPMFADEEILARLASRPQRPPPLPAARGATCEVRTEQTCIVRTVLGSDMAVPRISGGGCFGPEPFDPSELALPQTDAEQAAHAACAGLAAELHALLPRCLPQGGTTWIEPLLVESVPPWRAGQRVETLRILLDALWLAVRTDATWATYRLINVINVWLADGPPPAFDVEAAETLMRIGAHPIEPLVLIRSSLAGSVDGYARDWDGSAETHWEDVDASRAVAALALEHELASGALCPTIQACRESMASARRVDVAALGGWAERVAPVLGRRMLRRSWLERARLEWMRELESVLWDAVLSRRGIELLARRLVSSWATQPRSES